MNTLCKHSAHGDPATCSQCLGCKPRRIECNDTHYTLDGQPVRAIDDVPSGAPRRRGQRRRRAT